MNPRYIVAGIAAVAVVLFAAAYFFYSPPQPAYNLPDNASKTGSEATNDSALIRPYSPVIGPKDAPVTIVEFFDPGCEACRAFHPTVKAILADNPEKVRLVLRYAAFHDGSDTAVKILESARRQGKFMPVLEALLAAQMQWASHDGAKLEFAWQAAERAGLDRALAEEQIKDPAITVILIQEAKDIKQVGVQYTPTFFVNGLPLLDHSPAGLKKMVSEQVKE